MRTCRVDFTTSIGAVRRTALSEASASPTISPKLRSDMGNSYNGDGNSSSNTQRTPRVGPQPAAAAAPSRPSGRVPPGLSSLARVPLVGRSSCTSQFDVADHALIPLTPSDSNMPARIGKASCLRSRLARHRGGGSARFLTSASVFCGTSCRVMIDPSERSAWEAVENCEAPDERFPATGSAFLVRCASCKSRAHQALPAASSNLSTLSWLGHCTRSLVS